MVAAAGAVGSDPGRPVVSRAAAEVVPLFALYLGGWVGSARRFVYPGLRFPTDKNAIALIADAGYLYREPQRDPGVGADCEISEMFSASQTAPEVKAGPDLKSFAREHLVAVGRELFCKMVFAARASPVGSSSSPAFFRFLG